MVTASALSRQKCQYINRHLCGHTLYLMPHSGELADILIIERKGKYESQR